jgi:hypothetical protein
MGELIPYEVFKQKQREKKYGKPLDRLQGLGLPNDFTPFAPSEDDMMWVDQIMQSEDKDDGRRDT